MKKTINFDAYIYSFYFVPFFSYPGIKSLITGVSEWGPYKEGLNSFQVRMIGLIVLIFCIYITYVVLIQWPKLRGNYHKVKEVIKVFLTSIFFYLWMISLLLVFIYEIYQKIFLKILYFAIIGACIYFQYKFIKIIEFIVSSHDDN